MLYSSEKDVENMHEQIFSANFNIGVSSRENKCRLLINAQ